MPYWSTIGLSPQDQAGYWGDVVCEAFTPLAPKRSRSQLDRSAITEGVPGWVRSEALVETNCAEIASCTQLLTHGPSEVRRSPMAAVFVNLQLAGTCYGEQDDRQCVVTPGSLAIFDTTRPYRLEFTEPEGASSWRVLSFRIPRDRWSASVRHDDLTANSLDTTSGPGSIVGSMMSSLWQQRQTLDRLTVQAVERSFTDVLAAVTSAQSRHTAESETERRDDALRMIVQRHIRTSIPLGRVTAEAAARSAAISVRSLHRLFEANDTSFAECVRQERLHGAMADLTASSASASLSEIAGRWGFYDSSHLTRTFQRYLDCTPSEYRSLHRGR